MDIFVKETRGKDGHYFWVCSHGKDGTEVTIVPHPFNTKEDAEYRISEIKENLGKS